jgi:hypothetical protein
MKIASLLTVITFVAIMIEPRVLHSMQSAVMSPATGSSVLFSGKTLLIVAAVGGIGYVVYRAQTKPGFSEDVQENLSSVLSWANKRKVLVCVGAVALVAGGCLARAVSNPLPTMRLEEVVPIY